MKLMSWSNCYLFLFSLFLFTALKMLTTEQPKDAKTVNIACPALFPPPHGYLECSRPIENSTMTSTGRLRITNRPGSQCILRCPTRYFFCHFIAPCIPLRLKHFIDHKLYILLLFFFPLFHIPSYRAVGKFSKTCGENGNWYGDESGVCMSKFLFFFRLQ